MIARQWLHTGVIPGAGDIYHSMCVALLMCTWCAGNVYCVLITNGFASALCVC